MTHYHVLVSSLPGRELLEVHTADDLDAAFELQRKLDKKFPKGIASIPQKPCIGDCPKVIP